MSNIFTVWALKGESSCTDAESSEREVMTSLSGDLRIAELVDQNMMVTMHIPKSLFAEIFR